MNGVDVSDIRGCIVFGMFSDIFGCFRIRKVRTVFGSDSDGPVSDSSIRFDRSVETRGSIASHN